MTAKLQREVKIEGLGEVYKVEAPFDEALNSFRAGMIYPLSARDFAFARMQTGKGSSLSNEGTYVREAVLYTPNVVANPALIVRESPLLERLHSQKATETNHIRGDYSVETGEFKEKAIEDRSKRAEERRVFFLRDRNNFEIPTDEFSKNDLVTWLFQDQTKAYGEFLRSAGIENFSVEVLNPVYVNRQESSFIRQLWFPALSEGIDLGGYGRSLAYGVRVHGVDKTISV